MLQWELLFYTLMEDMILNLITGMDEIPVLVAYFTSVVIDCQWRGITN